MSYAQIAKHTLEILEEQSYTAPDGSTIDLSDDLKDCLDHTRCYGPHDLEHLRSQLAQGSQPAKRSTRLEVLNETTLEGAKRLATDEGYASVGVLNFASATNPGGGFIKGATAQEETLARSSGLYSSLRQCPGFYEYHRAHRSSLYSHRMIWSPRCPVFRTDNGRKLKNYYRVNFITSPAPNAGAIFVNEPDRVSDIEPTIAERSGLILALALHHGCDALVLGAWGCGVFKNHPETVARAFHEHLTDRAGPFYNRFKKVLFSVLDDPEKGKIIRPFEEYLLS